MFEDIVAALKNGEIAVIPTDTIFGIVASALNPTAVEHVYELKERDSAKACIILLDEASQLFQFGVAQTLIEQTVGYWPGPNSLIFPISDKKKWRYLHRGTGELAFRVPDNKWLKSLLQQTGPLVAPSANPEGLPPATSIEEAMDYFGDSVHYAQTEQILSGRPSMVFRVTLSGIEQVR